MLTIFTSFGDSWFAGTQVGNNMKTRRRHNRNTQIKWTNHGRLPRILNKGPTRSAPAKDGSKPPQTGLGRTHGWAEPLLRRFRLIFGGKIVSIYRERPPSLSTINRGNSLLPQHTPTHLSFISPSYICSSVPLGVLHLVVF